MIHESPYAASKRSAELMVRSLVQKSAMSATALRFFTVYGARQRPEMAITLFARALLAGTPIKMFGDGSMRRDFTHVDDIVRGVVAACDRTTAGYHLYNLGSGAPIDLAGLVRELGKATGREPIIERAAVPQGDVDATFADISRAKAELGWAPRVQLSDGLATVVDWVRANP
jgi:UDP-glucuronate 4-epimerase